jgi:predicted N-acyltransferase
MVTLQAIGSIKDIGADVWDRCANPPSVPHDPFLSYAFLSALEESGSAVAGTGWAPYHLTVEEEGITQGVVPMYLKNHSQGEYVFDYAWADAFERAGGRYYPKLQISVPFTPATGRRFLVADVANRDDLEGYLLAGCMQIAEKMEVSSIHATFVEERQWQRLVDLGMLGRTHKQFHWVNDGYGCFDDFLAALSSKKRKNIRRERRDALSTGVVVEALTGDQLEEEHWDAFYRFYVDTGNRKWGSAYLTREFFSIIGRTMPERVLLMMCQRDGQYIAGAINFIGDECLFGRNWGCIEDHRFLHFETCYYRAIEWAIDHNLARVEAGAQGPHKLARGYLPSHTYSAHWIANESFRDAVNRFLEDEREYVDQDIEYIEEHSPFRKETDS